MRICFLARPSFDKYSVLISKCIKDCFDENIESFFVTTDKDETEYVLQQIPNAHVYETSRYLKENWDGFTRERLIEYERKYDCAPIWKYIYTDRFLIECNYDYAIHIAVGLLSFFEEIFSKNTIEYYYSETIATFQCYAAYIVGKKYGTKYISQMTARGLDSTYHYFLDDEFQSNINFDQNYMFKQYSDEEFRFADEFLKEFETKDIKPKNMIFSGAKPKFKAKFFLLPLFRIIRSFSSKFNNPYAYMYYHSHRNITNPIFFYIRYLRSRKYYNEADYDENYVYLPLHYQPEASTIVCAQKYEKQIFFVDSLAKSLPADTVLYVKEHYAILGHRDIQFYKELKKFPNVILIDPWESSRKLIENAQAIATLTGTAGWEAMLLRKPVFIGGNIFFDNAPGMIKINDIYDNYLNNIKMWKQPRREVTIKYLCEYFRSLRKGNVFSENPKSLESTNIFDVTKSLYEQISK